MPNSNIFGKEDNDLPFISVIITVYNEEQVIEEKINSLLNTNYPQQKIEILIGSDGSSDSTISIIRRCCEKHKMIRLFDYTEQRGKSAVLNDLKRESRYPVLLLTDANVLFEPETIYHLVKHFKNPAISLVDGNIVNRDSKQSGISFQEKTYLKYEKSIKHNEGLVLGTAIGAFGGCYAVRTECFPIIPANFAVEDFYITMYALKNGGKAIKEPKAVCEEDVSDIPSEEFRRKVRISTGNWQNLLAYKKLLTTPWKPVSFCFISHKVIRWLGPLLLLCAFTANAAIYQLTDIKFYSFTLIAQLLLLLSPTLDFFLKEMKINVPLLRFISHFYMMNLALLIGMVKTLTGMSSGAWQPTKRRQ